MDQSPKTFSCVRCFERKVKCDKQSPCSNCMKSKAECNFRIPPPSRRRRKKPHDEVLLARLKHCEDLLRSKGVDINSPASSNPQSLEYASRSTDGTSTIPSPEVGSTPRGASCVPFAKPGQLIIEHGKSRFIENNLWASVSDEVCD